MHRVTSLIDPASAGRVVAIRYSELESNLHTQKRDFPEGKMAWHLRKKPTGVKPVSSVKPVQPVKAVKPIKPVRPVKPVAPVGHEYYWKD
jgi:hypothetical protein